MKSSVNVKIINSKLNKMWCLEFRSCNIVDVIAWREKFVWIQIRLNYKETKDGNGLKWFIVICEWLCFNE